MKTIGLIGGASSESTEVYYRLINHKVNRILGGHHSAKIVLISLDFEPIVKGFFTEDWEHIAQIIIQAGQKLERAGVDFQAICCNTLHKVVPQLLATVNTPFLHILEPVGRELKRRKINRIGILGTKFTLNYDFHKNYLMDNFKIETVVPYETEIEKLNKIIFTELCYHNLNPDSQKFIINIIENMKKNGAEAIILACTELHLLLSDNDINIPLLDTTALHAEAIVKYSLNISSEIENNQSNILIHESI